jgi:hypothetical protein
MGLLVLVAGALVVTVAAPASAAPSHVCETSGDFCLGAPSLVIDAPVRATVSGRDVVLRGVGNNQVEIILSADTSECVAAANNRMDVVLHHCDGGLGTVWIKHNLIAPFKYESREFPGWYLAGRNVQGSQFQLKQDPTGGWLLRFDVS